MDIAFDREAFARGVERACRDRGDPGASAFVMKLAEFGAEAQGLGDGFVKGAASVIDRLGFGDDEYESRRKKSLFRRMLPWALAIGGGALALQYGDMWGRHAEATNNDLGPVRGTIDAILNVASGGRFRYSGRQGGAPKDEYHAPLSNDQYNDLVVHGSKLGPAFFDEIGAREKLPSEA